MAGRNIARGQRVDHHHHRQWHNRTNKWRCIVVLFFVLCLSDTPTVFQSISSLVWTGQSSSGLLSAHLVVSAAETASTRGRKQQQQQQQQDGVDPNNNSLQEQNNDQKSLNQLLLHAAKRGLGGGLPGAIAGVVQVLTLMWLRTIINYQSRYGTSFMRAVTTLYNEGGVARFYRGLVFALVQAPLARFVSTAANDGVEVLLASLEATKDWGPGRTTVVASIVVGIWRMIIMPIDTCKTVLQVDSRDGFRNLMRRVRAGKIGVLYQGAVANAMSSVMGHYPWFYTFNTLSRKEWVHALLPSKLLRNAGIGLAASIVADTSVNAIRVVKTTKQSIGSKHDLSYADTIRMVLAADGWKGLFGRGLRTRIFANSLQSIVFAVIWRGLSERWSGSGSDGDAISKESDNGSSSSGGGGGGDEKKTR